MKGKVSVLPSHSLRMREDYAEVKSMEVDPVQFTFFAGLVW